MEAELICDRASHIFIVCKILNIVMPGVQQIVSVHVLDDASTSFQLKIKQAIHIQREQPSWNQQLHHVNVKLSVQFSHFHSLLHSVVTIHHN